jgi:hypothetical protein
LEHFDMILDCKKVSVGGIKRLEIEYLPKTPSRPINQEVTIAFPSTQGMIVLGAFEWNVPCYEGI